MDIIKNQFASRTRMLQRNQAVLSIPLNSLFARKNVINLLSKLLIYCPKHKYLDTYQFLPSFLGFKRICLFKAPTFIFEFIGGGGGWTYALFKSVENLWHEVILYW